MKNTEIKKIFIVSSEESGSRIGALLMKRLKSLLDNKVQFFGIGGKQMIDEGLISTSDIENICHMGIFEVVRHIGKIVDTLIETEKSIRAINPDIVICIDSQDFAKRLFSRIKDLKTLKCQYVAPSVWAWRENRAKSLKGLINFLFTLFPFENKFFEKHGIKTFCVGHNIIENDQLFNINNDIESDFCKRFDINKEEKSQQKIITLLPGSRISEVSRHLKIMADAVQKIKERIPDIKIFIPTTDITLNYIEKNLKFFDEKLKPILIHEDIMKYTLFKNSDIAIAASGTVTLELGLTKTPAVVVYKVNPLTAWFIKRMIKIKHVNLVNILMNKKVYTELLQENATAEKIAATAINILSNKKTRNEMKNSLNEFYDYMVSENHGMLPTEKAANIIAKELLEKKITCDKDDD